MPALIILVGLWIWQSPIGLGHVDTQQSIRAEQVKIIMEQEQK